MNKLVLLFFSRSLVACHSVSSLTEDTTFQHYDKMWRSSGKLVLKKDGTFNYKYAIGLIEAESRGQWSQQAKGRILMTGDSSYNVGFLEVRSLGRQFSEDSIMIRLVDKTNNKLLKDVNVTVGKGQRFLTNASGEIFLKKSIVDKLQISYFPEQYSWEFAAPPKEDLEIKIIPKDLSKTYFDQEVWLLKKRKLIDPAGTVFKLVK